MYIIWVIVSSPLILNTIGNWQEDLTSITTINKNQRVVDKSIDSKKIKELPKTERSHDSAGILVTLLSKSNI